jgi:hypothetical protein
MRSAANPGGVLATLAVGFALTGGSLRAADPVTTGEKTDWSKFVTVSTITAEVRSVDGDSVKLRVYWMAHGSGGNGNGNGNNNNNNRNNNNNNRRPSLYHHSRNGRQQYNPLQRMVQMARSQQQNVHQEHHDYDVGYFADTRVTGVKGTDGAPATVASLTPGTVVNAFLVHDRSIALKDMKDSDLRVRSIASLGHNPHYKADASNNPPKKK